MRGWPPRRVYWQPGRALAMEHITALLQWRTFPTRFSRMPSNAGRFHACRTHMVKLGNATSGSANTLISRVNRRGLNGWPPDPSTDKRLHTIRRIQEPFAIEDFKSAPSKEATPAVSKIRWTVGTQGTRPTYASDQGMWPPRSDSDRKERKKGWRPCGNLPLPTSD